jgi:acyl-CoA thioester hydrolase
LERWYQPITNYQIFLGQYTFMDNSFPFQTPIEVIFRDVDAMGHVNNAVYFTYLETARTRFFFQGLSIGSLGELPVILAEASCAYRSAARFAEKLVVGLGVSRIGSKSFELAYRITAEDGRLVADAKTVMVAYDYEKESTLQIPANLNKLLQSHLLVDQSGR